MIEIEILDPVFSKINKPEVVIPILSYKKVIYKQTPFNYKQKKYKTVTVVDGNIFLTGLVNRIESWLKQNDIPYSIKKENIDLLLSEIKTTSPKLKRITLRPDQERLVEAAIREKRGIIISPTGSGKTILAMAIISAFPDSKVLYLAHSTSIIEQTKEELEKQFPDQVSSSLSKNKRITITTIQNIKNHIALNKIIDVDITIVDEVHHAGVWKGMYYKVMTRNISPVRIGFTATLPTQKEKILCIEGLFGPVIDELTLKEGEKMQILAKPKVKLIPVKKMPSLSELRKYKEIYAKAITKNRHRNRLIIQEALNKMKENKTTLIIVKEIEHGNNIQQLAKKLYNIEIPFVQGKTETETREKIRKTFIEKKIKCVIATAVWKEGVNIPTLDCIINACGGKSELSTLQTVGRGLRKTDEKEIVEIIDLLDPYRYLAEHSIMRIQLYAKNNWL